MSMITGKLPVAGVTTLTLSDYNGKAFSSATSDAQGNFTVMVADSLANSITSYPGQTPSIGFQVSYSGAFNSNGKVEYWNVLVASGLFGCTGVYTRAQVVSSPLW